MGELPNFLCVFVLIYPDVRMGWLLAHRLVAHMGINPGCFATFMPEQCLNAAKIRAISQQMKRASSPNVDCP